MKKVFCLALTIALAAGSLTGCIDFKALLKKEDFDRNGFITGNLSEKYGGTFEITGHEGSLTAFSSVDFVRCVENGVEFETHIKKNDGVWEMVSDSYLFMLYMPNFQQDTENILNECLTDYKLVSYGSDKSHTQADFSLPAPADYAEYKQTYKLYLKCDVYLRESEKSTDEGFSAFQEILDSYSGSDGLNISFNFYTVPDELLERYDFYLPEYDTEIYNHRNIYPVEELNSDNTKSQAIVQE